MGNKKSTQKTPRDDVDVRSTTQINVLDEDFGQQETEVRMMTIQALKLVKLCKNQYESDDIFISDDNKKCPREFMDSMKYVAKYIMNKRSYNSYDQINYFYSHEKDDKGTDPFKKKIHPTKKKKKGKGIAERLNKKRYKVSLSAKPFNIEETTQKKNNEYDGNIVTRQEKPLSADILFSPSVRTKQNADDILRQEPDIKIQAMTEEAERLETICKNQHFKQRHTCTIQDHSRFCPISFLQAMLHIEDYLYDLRIHLDVIKREKIYYANRLSSVEGSILTENKPNITDLNDPNRATKLAEKWCKIFDDEWTDALDSLEKKYSKKNHEQYVHHLFSLIEVIYKTCRTKTEEQVGIFLLLNNASSTQVNDMWSQLSVPVRQNFYNNRKQMAEANIKMLKETVIQDDIYKTKIREINPALNEEILDLLQKSSYFEACLKICWQFVIQDPPLYLDVAPLKGDMLNKDTHKEYTQSGTIIKYVVWPALYLYCTDKKKGPLLSKGVVQPEDLTIDH